MTYWLCRFDGSVHRRGVHHEGDERLVPESRIADRLTLIAALADEWEADRGIVSPDSRYTRDVLVSELRAALRQASERES